VPTIILEEHITSILREEEEEEEVLVKSIWVQMRES
jgi:hypothetical protein